MMYTVAGFCAVLILHVLVICGAFMLTANWTLNRYFQRKERFLQEISRLQDEPEN